MAQWRAQVFEYQVFEYQVFNGLRSKNLLRGHWCACRPRDREGAKHGSAEKSPLVQPRRHAFGSEVARLEAELSVLRAKIHELEWYVDIDALTEVFNRRAFDREFKRASAHVARYGGSVALVYIDLDGFKFVNDCPGHATGDAVLKAIVLALLANVRTSDTVARLGGDDSRARCGI